MPMRDHCQAVPVRRRTSGHQSVCSNSRMLTVERYQENLRSDRALPKASDYMNSATWQLVSIHGALVSTPAILVHSLGVHWIGSVLTHGRATLAAESGWQDVITNTRFPVKMWLLCYCSARVQGPLGHLLVSCVSASTTVVVTFTSSTLLCPALVYGSHGSRCRGNWHSIPHRGISTSPEAGGRSLKLQV